jgi:hypothetical protein
MGKSLKDQLMQAGFRSNKMENHRESAKGRERKQSEKHQTTRNFCEHCSLIHPDVERYKHRMPTTEAEWICLGCADKLMIDDKFRVSQQSDVSKKGMFKRYFGATKDFSQERPRGGQERRPPRANGNKKPQGGKNRDNHAPKKERNFNK